LIVRMITLTEVAARPGASLDQASLADSAARVPSDDSRWIAFGRLQANS